MKHSISRQFSTRAYCILSILIFTSILHAQERSVSPGINSYYQNPDWQQWVNTFERPGREVYDKRYDIVDAAGVTALAGYDMYINSAIVLLAIVIGILNVTDKESGVVMIAALVVAAGVAALGFLPMNLPAYLTAIFARLTVLAVPLGVTVAGKVFYNKINTLLQSYPEPSHSFICNRKLCRPISNQIFEKRYD